MMDTNRIAASEAEARIQFDIFENSSPQREGDDNWHILPDEPVDETTSPSRKRRHTRTRSSNSVLSEVEHDVNVHKRRRSSKLPNLGSENNEPTLDNWNSADTPGRPSKFTEASMHDRPSQQPPSMFTRTAGLPHPADNMDILMDRYDEECRRSPTKSPAKRSKKQQDFTHHSNTSKASAATGITNESHGSKSGMYRFGRNLVSAFNPRNVINNLSAQWQQAKEELMQERLEQQERDQLKELAERKYQEMKQAGLLNKKGFTAKVEQHQRHTRQCESPVKNEARQRDSGIQLDDDFHAALEQEMMSAPSRSASPTKSVSPAKTSRVTNTPGSKVSFLRSPSLANLKRISSLGNINKSRRSSGIHLSPEKQDGLFSAISRNSSRQDLDKQAKLQKRVSNLESKLDAARRELQILADAPPVPSIPTEHLGSTTSIDYQGGNKSNRNSKSFAPLPTLPSERLLNNALLHADRTEQAEFTPKMEQPATTEEMETYPSISEALPSIEFAFAGNPFSQEYKQAPKVGAAPPDMLRKVVGVTENAATTTATQESQLTFLNSTSSPAPSVGETPNNAPRRSNRKRKSLSPDLYCSDDNDNDDDFIPDTTSVNKKKRLTNASTSSKESPHGTTFTSRKTSKASNMSLDGSCDDEADTFSSPPSPAIPRYKADPFSTPAIPTKLPNLPLPVPSPVKQAKQANINRISGEWTHTRIPLTSPPERPTAIKTPAHPSGIANTAHTSVVSQRVVKQRRIENKPGQERELAVCARPDVAKGVPDMPALPQTENKKRKSAVAEDFEWPDDVF